LSRADDVDSWLEPPRQSRLFASHGASLRQRRAQPTWTVSGIFPLEIRAVAIAFFHAIGTSIGGAVAPWSLGTLLDTGSRASVAVGYNLGTALMIAAASLEWRWGVAAQRRSLEQVCRPLTCID
jgi:hypothetical protein